MLPPDPPPEPDVLADTRHLFHLLQGRLTVITSAAEDIKDESAAPLSARQREHIATILAQAAELSEIVRVTGDALLNTLVLTPAYRLIWNCACRNGTRIRKATFVRHVDQMRKRYPLHPVTTAIALAEAELLAPLRAAFEAAGCAVRVATRPADVRPMLDAAHAELVVVAPPAGSASEWWRIVRLSLQTYANQPLFMHVLAIPTNTQATSDAVTDV